jgi:hydroxylamine reductase (hybrid-cluster protein)
MSDLEEMVNTEIARIIERGLKLAENSKRRECSAKLTTGFSNTSLK